MKDVDNLTHLIMNTIRKLQNDCSNNWCSETDSIAGEAVHQKDSGQGTKRDFKELYRERRI